MMYQVRYVLDRGVVRKAKNDEEWIRFFDWEKHLERHFIKKINIGDIWVSTIFLHTDYYIGSEPVLFETMAFPSDSMVELLTERHATIEQAKEAHERIVKELISERLKYLVVYGLHVSEEIKILYSNPYVYGKDTTGE